LSNFASSASSFCFFAEPEKVIEARENIYNESDVVDMTVVYSYCLDNDIKVGMVDG
jgi:hypothetical protein